MFEAVARATANDPDIFVSRMAIDDEVAVRSLFILADAGFEQRSIFEGGEAEGNIFADAFQRFLTHDTFAVRRVEVRSAGVVGDFKSTAGVALDGARNAVV